MLEKNSHVVLTEDDISQYNNGIVSDRVKQTWNIYTIEELRGLIETQQVINNSYPKVS